ncbi:MAG: aldo/keto reductase [Saprospiraceae bacterium]|nr:aldo/keto reductase [Saprospiraceae bacterium]
MPEFVNCKNVRFSPLMLGTVQLGLNYGISNLDGLPEVEKSIQLLDQAMSLGINTLDTARAYGQSEEVISRFLKKRTPELPVNIISKFVIDNQNRDLESIWNQVEESVRKSLQILQLPKLTGCLFHRSLTNNLDVLVGILPEIFNRLKESGLVDRTGFSAFSPDDIKYILEIPNVEIVQLPFNVFDQRMLVAGYLRDLKKRNILVVARSVFLQGLFFMNPDSLPEELAEAAPHIRKLHEFSARYNISLAQVAIVFVRDQPDIDCLVLGALNSQQVSEIVELFQAPKLTGEQMKILNDQFPVDNKLIITPAYWPAKK